MNRNRSAAVAASVGLILMSSAWAVAQDPEPPRARVRLPIAGTAIGHGKDTFTGTLSIERFAVRGETIVAVGMVTGRVLDKSGNPRGTAVVGQVEVPVQVGSGPSAATPSRMAVQQASSCAVLHLDLGAINLNLLGVQFVTTPITLDLTATSDAGGVLGQLICTALDTVGNVVDLVGVLNSILSLLTGLLGGLTGGLTGGVTPTP
jgi:hypothetical protein